eukprot:SM000007S20987  [mRNA]  locus=s7:1290729:1296304:+ [translate_table: standard]
MAAPSGRARVLQGVEPSLRRLLAAPRSQGAAVACGWLLGSAGTQEVPPTIASAVGCLGGGIEAGVGLDARAEADRQVTRLASVTALCHTRRVTATYRLVLFVNAVALRSLVPAGIDVLGAYFTSEAETAVQPFLQSIQNVFAVLYEGAELPWPLLAAVGPSSVEYYRGHAASVASWQPLDVEVLPRDCDWLWGDHSILRCKLDADISLSCFDTLGGAGVQANIEAAMKTLAADLTRSNVSFLVHDGHNERPILVQAQEVAERLASHGQACSSGDKVKPKGEQTKSPKDSRSTQVSAYHFMPEGLPHPVTAVYPLSYGEVEQVPVDIRMDLHRRLGLPMDRPLLRTANAMSFNAEGSPTTGTRLVDVHVGLQPSGVVGGQPSLVQGSYQYFHYMQDHMDDNGWGCAYRSLQTIMSWFLLQHYTGLAVPNHRSIQQTLVDLGDKPPSFVGSCQWIGAIELSYILDQLLGVTCRILNIQSGADMPSKGRELAHHFDTQGTPVMIGGGVLAYTLLGVDYNEMTGECAFLILDPHYTGGEDLKTIRSGGWCGWKSAVTEKGKDFFVRDAFYNLLLPQRPAMVFLTLERRVAMEGSSGVDEEASVSRQERALLKKSGTRSSTGLDLDASLERRVGRGILLTSNGLRQLAIGDLQCPGKVASLPEQLPGLLQDDKI